MCIRDRRQDEEDQAEAGSEGGDGILDAVGAAADVEENDGDERDEAELRANPGAHVAWATLISSGKPVSHSSIGVSASTMISNLPLGTGKGRVRRMPSGITTA